LKFWIGYDIAIGINEEMSFEFMNDERRLIDGVQIQKKTESLISQKNEDRKENHEELSSYILIILTTRKYSSDSQITSLLTANRNHQKNLSKRFGMNCITYLKSNRLICKGEG
jgi:hypothetical protein